MAMTARTRKAARRGVRPHIDRSSCSGAPPASAAGPRAQILGATGGLSPLAGDGVDGDGCKQNGRWLRYWKARRSRTPLTQIFAA